MASRLALLFAEKNIQAREQLVSQTVTILQKKLTEVKEQADLLERKLNDYKVAHAGELPEAIPFNYEQINRMNLQLDELNQRIRNLEERKRYPEAAFGSQSASDPASGAAVATDPWTRVSQLRMQLVNLRTRYSDRHPDVIKTKSELRQMEMRLGISSEKDENLKKLEELKNPLAELKASKEPQDPEILETRDVRGLVNENFYCRIWHKAGQIGHSHPFLPSPDAARKLLPYSNRLTLVYALESEHSDGE